MSVLGHVLVLLALLSTRADSVKAVAPEPVAVELALSPPVIVPPPPAPPDAAPPSPAPPAPTPPAAAPPKPTKSPPRRSLFRPAPAPMSVAAMPAAEGPEADDAPQLSDAQIASAATAGSGPPGRSCDMAQRLQTALRRDSRVMAAVADANREAGATGRAMLVWNGDWIRSHGQDGNGLAAVREAIMWEVAFSPKACRVEPVHGLVLLSLADHPGGARVVIGSGAWQWSDLLGLHSPGAGESLRR